MKTYTRQDYMNKVCTHREYYSQFVNRYIKDSVSSLIGLDRILNSNDEHFNDIPLQDWDNIQHLTFTSHQGTLLKERDDSWCLSHNTCVLKECARQLKYENTKR